MVQRPVKFVRAGGLFACGGYKFEDVEKDGRFQWVIYSGDNSGEGGTTNWSKVFEKTQSDLYYPWAAAYGLAGANPEADPPKPGTPTFIMAGIEVYFGTSESDLPFFKISILSSNDGELWTESYEEKKGWPYAAAWDAASKRFLVECVVDIEFDDHKRAVFASTDGFSWMRVETRAKPEDEDPTASPLMEATGTYLVKDEYGNVVPNGSYYGLSGDLNKNFTLVRPGYLNPYITTTPGGTPGDPATATKKKTIEIIGQTVDPESGKASKTFNTLSMPFEVISVGYAGGVFQATGTQRSEDLETPGLWMIASSYDDGETWQPSLSVQSCQGLCVIGGPEMVK